MIRLAPAAARIRSRRFVAHESDLEWYWSEGTSLFEGSSFGAVIERQAHFGQELVPCDRCDGSGFTATDGTCRSCRGIGGRARRLKARRSDGNEKLLYGTRRCSACRGRTGQAACPHCRGAGAVELAPVGLAARRGEEPSYAPNEAALTKYAQVSRWLMRTPTAAVRVLEAYYGLDGYRCGATKWGRLLAVLPLTAAGRGMLAAVDNPFGLTAIDLLGNMVDQIERLTDVGKQREARKGIALAMHEASALYRMACVEWNAAVDRRSNRRA